MESGEKRLEVPTPTALFFQKCFERKDLFL